MDIDREMPKRYVGSFIAVLASLFAFVTRVQPIEQFIENAPQFGTQTAWYQFRSTLYTVHNWPQTLQFDPWSGYPTGTTLGTFGTIYDQLLATISLIIGLGSPSETTVAYVVLLAPPVLGALTVFTAYFTAKEIGGKPAGAFASIAVAIMPGAWFLNSITGTSGKETIVTFTLILATYYLIKTFKRLQESTLTIPRLLQGDITNEQDFLLSCAKASLSVAVFVLTTPKGSLLIGIIGVFLFISTSIQRARVGTIHQPLIIATVLVGLVSAIASGVVVDTSTFTFAEFSLLQVFLSLGLVQLGLFSYVFDEMLNDYTAPLPVVFPALLSVIVAGSIVGTVFVSEQLFNEVTGGILSVFGLWFVGGSTANTVLQTIISAYGAIFVFGLIGVTVALYTYYTEDSLEHLFLSVLFLLLLSTSITTSEFYGQFAPILGVAVGLGVYRLISFIDVPDSFPDLQAYQYLSVLLMILVVLPSIFVPVSGSVLASPSTYYDSSEQDGWASSMEWLENDTPQPELEYYGTYKESSFIYPEDSYGVVTIPSKSNLITVDGGRIAVSNSMRVNENFTSQFLLAQSEAQATQLTQQQGTNVQYVVVSRSMVLPNQGFADIVQTHPQQNVGQYYFPLYSSSGEFVGHVRSQAYYNSMAVQLYAFHGSAVGSQPVVVDWDVQETQQGQIAVTPPEESGTLLRFDSLAQARQYAEEDGTAQVGGVANNPPQSLSALQNYRLVHASSETVEGTDNIGKTKIFERVPGATVRGSAPANSTVQAVVELETQNGRTFEYIQVASVGPNGDFTMTLPYSTRGYDKFGPKSGYSNVTTRAVSSYEFTAYYSTNGTQMSASTTAEIPESAVIGETSEPIIVSIEESSDDSSE